MKHILITGMPGSGKSTACRRIISALQQQQQQQQKNTGSAAGSKAAAASTAASRGDAISPQNLRLIPSSFITEERRSNGQRTGFQFVFFDDTVHTVPLATTEPVANAPRVGKYSVMVHKRDEIGKMECLSNAFCVAIKQLLIDENNSPSKGGSLVVATVPMRGTRFIEELKSNTELVEILELTTENRDDIPGAVLARAAAWCAEKRN